MPVSPKSIKSLKARIAELEAELATRANRENYTIRSLLHDIKNPLAVSLGSLQVAKLAGGEALSPKVKRLLDAAEDGGKAQLAIIQNLSDQIKIEMGELGAVGDLFHPGPIIHKRIDPLRHIEPNKALFFDNLSPDVRVEGDRDLFDRVVQNLLDNSLRHTHKGATINMEADFDAATSLWTLKLMDDGEEIAHDQLEEIFDRHFVTLTHRPGARRDIGMGLSFARMATEAMGGSLKAIATDGIGVIFHLTLRGKS